MSLRLTNPAVFVINSMYNNMIFLIIQHEMNFGRHGKHKIEFEQRIGTPGLFIRSIETAK